MAEHDPSDNERRARLQSIEEIEEREHGLIDTEPFISWQRRKATKQSNDARSWAERNPEWAKIAEGIKSRLRREPSD